MQNSDVAQAIKQTCELLSQGKTQEAGLTIKNHYPFNPIKRDTRNYTPAQMMPVFVRDGFIDRYKGDYMIFPATLRLISHYLPTEFPYQSSWKMDECHVAYWELFPTIDHVIPIARGGKDEISNWVCCSMLTNGIKSNWTLEQLGWKILPPGDINLWDGLLYWFFEQVESDKTLLKNNYFKTWHNAAKPYKK